MEISPNWITGFFDGEGCFTLYIRSDKQVRKNHISVYHRWQVDCAISLRGDDVDVLHKFKNYFETGIISFTKEKNPDINLPLKCMYHVTSTEDLLNKVIPHFNKYPLVSKKAADFILWSEAVKIIHEAKQRKKHVADKVVYSEVENKKLFEILDSLKKRLTGKHLLYQKKNLNLEGTKTILQKQ